MDLGRLNAKQHGPANLDTRAMIDAFKKKASLLEARKSEISNIKIFTEKPVVYTEEKKFEHSQAVVLANRQPRPSAKQTTVSRNIPEVHKKLSQRESFPNAYKKLADPTVSNISGDYLEKPREASVLLMNTSSADLNMPGRSADYSSEVKWRMQLRNTPDPRYA